MRPHCNRLDMKSRFVAPLLVAFIILSVSCDRSQDERLSRLSEEYVVSSADEYARWLSEPGISEFELERRICEVRYRTALLQENGDTLLSRRFFEEVRTRYDMLSSNGH